MSAREAKREACRITAMQVNAYMEAGQPMEDHGCENECAECARLVLGLVQLRNELERRGGNWERTR